ncbi:MAG: methyltransferase domain-containing protein [Phycisphaeraceae bacterium]
MLDPKLLLECSICPACGQRLRSFDRCEACGARYGQEEGVPVLIPADAHREVRVPFRQNRAAPGEAFTRCFRYPPRRGASGSKTPHHLDLAHQDVLEHQPKGTKVLEIGCGGGQMRAWAEDRGLVYVGTDISRTRVREHLRRHGGPDLLCDAHFLPFADGSFDVVYSAAVTEHLASPFLVAQEVARVLRPGGVYLGNVSFLEPWHGGSFFHMSPMGVFELLSQAEFEIDCIWPGEGYSGYRALCSMGNRVTRPLAFVGDGLFLVYRWSSRLRDRMRQGRPADGDGIADLARVAGATDWIARKPAKAPAPAADRSAEQAAIPAAHSPDLYPSG